MYAVLVVRTPRSFRPQVAAARGARERRPASVRDDRPRFAIPLAFESGVRDESRGERDGECPEEPRDLLRVVGNCPKVGIGIP